METVEKKLTPEVLKKLEGFTGFSISSEFDYEIPELKDAGVRAVFTLRARDGLDLAILEDRNGYVTNTDDGIIYRTKSGEVRVTTLETCLLKIKGYPLRDGKTLSYDAGTLSLTIGGEKVNVASARAVVRYLSMATQVALEKEIVRRSDLAPEEKTGLK